MSKAAKTLAWPRLLAWAAASAAVAVLAGGAAGAYSTAFTDVAATAGVENAAGQGDPLNPPPPPPLTPNVTWPQYVSLMHMWGGAAVGDFDNDGDPDVYVTNGDGGPSALYRNEGNLTFTDVAATAGVAKPGRSMGAAWGDYDNDGCRDLFVASFTGPSSLFRNNCDGTFANATGAANIALNIRAAGVAWGDIDRDGLLDLVVACYVVCPNVLLHNDGGTFSDETATAGVGDPGWTFQPMFLDYDQDGDLDLWDINDFGADRFYRNNDDGTFTDVTLPLGIDREGAGGMGGAVGDIDNDGWLDAFITNYYNDSLYRNTGGAFVETFSGSPVHDFLVGWGADFFDAENDGDLDLYIGNGFIFEQTHSRFQDDKFLENTGGGVFRNSTAALGTHGGVTHGVATADFDGDGDLDVFAVNLSGPSMLFRNDGQKGSWIKVRLEGTASNRDAVGALVTVRAGGLVVARIHLAGGSYLSQSDSTLHFGLGGAFQADSVTIEWPSGAHQVLANVSANQTIFVVEPPLLIAHAGPDPLGRPGVALNLSAALTTDPLDGTFPSGANFTWTIDLGGTAATLYGEQAAYTFIASGAYPASLRVEDSVGNIDHDPFIIYIRDERPPSANAGADQSVCDGAAVHLDGGNTTDNDPTFAIFGTFSWEVPMPSGSLTLAGRRTAFTPAVPGNYTVSMRAVDPSGNAANDTVRLAVADCTAPRVRLPATTYITEGDTLTLAANASDSSVDFGTAARFLWTFVAGAGSLNATGSALVYEFLIPGVFDVTVQVTDGAGNTAAASGIVVVADVTAPTAGLPDAYAGDEGSLIVLDASGATDNDPTFPSSATFTWVVRLRTPEGGLQHVTLYGEHPSYAFATPGASEVELTVTDRAGNTATARSVVEVRDRTAPSAHAGASRDVQAGATVNFEATAADNDPSFSADPANSTYAWSFDYAGRRVELSGAKSSFRFDEPGLYIVTLTVTDAAGNAAVEHVDIRVLAPSTDPTASAVRALAAALIGGAVALAVPAWRRAAKRADDEEGGDT